MENLPNIPMATSGCEITNPTMATPTSRKDMPASNSYWSVTHVTPIFDSTVYGLDYHTFTGLIIAAMVRVRALL